MDAIDLAVSSQDFLSDPVFGGLFSGSTQVGTTGGVGSMSPSGVPPVASGNYVVLDSSKKDSSGNPTVVGVVVDLSTQLGQQIASSFNGGTYKFDASSGVLSQSGASGGTSGASGASGGTSQSGTQQSLTYRTVSGGPGQNSWRVIWELSEASPDGGYIVQEVDVSEAITQPDGHTNTITKPSIWEAWTVLAGHTNAEPTNSQGYDDDFLFKDVRSSDPLSTTITGTARFFEGLTRATIRGDGFQPGNTTSQSGNLLTSQQNPNLSVQNATAPVNRKDTYVNPMQRQW
jgi:hypothetical protein